MHDDRLQKDGPRKDSPKGGGPGGFGSSYGERRDDAPGVGETEEGPGTDNPARRDPSPAQPARKAGGPAPERG